VPDTTTFPGEDYYQIRLGEFTQMMHPDLPGPTKFWGYADVTNGQAPNHRYLGGAIVAQKNRPVRLKAINQLPPVHPLPIDTTIMGAELEQNRACIHLHGGLVPWTSDGGPFAWFSPTSSGSSFLNGTGVPGEAVYRYPNSQSARLVWYHDHAIGITRLNAYAGIASAYIIRDDFEAQLISNGIIPSYEVPIIIQDKTFVSQAEVDKGYIWGKAGDLWYPTEYEKTGNPEGRWDYGPDNGFPAKFPLPDVSTVPEYFSDTSVVNGTLYPYLPVEQRHYRFRVLNGSQARFYNLQLYYAHPHDSGEPHLGRPGPRMIQIGNEAGFIPFPVALNHPPVPFSVKSDSDGDPIASTMKFNLLMAPAERADLIIDFSNVPVGSKLILYNDAPAPFPMGDPLNDYYTGDPDQTAGGGAPSTRPGLGPNTRTLMQFQVIPRVGPPDPPSLGLMEALAVNGAGELGHLIDSVLPKLERLQEHKAMRVRDLTLNETFDDYGRLIQLLGTSQVQDNVNGELEFGRSYDSEPTEVVHKGATEVWRIFNLTGDTHPMHFHLVNVQVLSRQPFNVAGYDGVPEFTGRARMPDANELGWKETVRMNPGECTTVIARFDLPRVPYDVPVSPRTGGFEYVWHCHILEHEEHDMMRPLIVKP
jgi:spore coat protein A